MLPLLPIRKNIYNYLIGVSSTAIIGAIPLPLLAQESAQEREQEKARDSQPQDELENDNETITVTADRIRGSVISEIPPIEVLNENDIASYGADSVSELLAALAPQTGSARGRGGGPPIVLINAQRVSGFRELRNIPPEAIVRIEILPEEVALQYGFKPDQRVINFILKDDFSSIDFQGQLGGSTSGGQITTDVGSTYTKFSKNSRFNADIDYETESILTEDERDIIQENSDNNAILAGPIGAQDIGQFRSLLPDSEKLELNLVYSRNLSKTTRISANAGYTYNDRFNLLGLNNPIFTLPASNQFNTAGVDQNVQRFFIEPRPLQSTSQSDAFEGGIAINGRLTGWIWSSTANISHSESDTQIDQNSNFALLSQQLLVDDNIDIFADILDPNVGPTQFISSSVKTTNFSNLNTISGTLFSIPNGEVTATFRGGYTYSRIDSESDQSGINVNTILSRDVLSFGGNIDIPITDTGVGIGRYLGKISINGNAGADDVSDFGSLTEYGFGVTWKPIQDLTLTFTSINEDSPPSIAQLGNPVIITPNVPIFDFTQSQTSFVQLTTGGNPNLLAERQRDIKVSLNYSPSKISGLNFIIDYNRNRSFNTSNAFPLLTPEIEAAFPDRVIRAADGTLLALDRTPVTFDRVVSERIRYGFNFSKSLGRANARRPNGTGRRRPTGARPQGARPQGARPQPAGATGGRPPGAGRGNGNAQRANGTANGARGGARPRRPGRYNISIFHTIALDETILIRPDVTELDLLDGSAIGSNGGAARHKIELEGGIFNNGLGARLSGDFSSATTVDGDILTGSSDLNFGSLATINFRLFYNLGSKEKITKSLPFLKGSRITLRMNNVFNAIQNITDETGEVPINFQRGFIDPRGRSVELSFRKRF